MCGLLMLKVVALMEDIIYLFVMIYTCQKDCKPNFSLMVGMDPKLMVKYSSARVWLLSPLKVEHPAAQASPIPYLHPFFLESQF